MSDYSKLKSIMSNEKAFFDTMACPVGTVFTPDLVAEKLVHMGLHRWCLQNGYLSYLELNRETWLKLRVLDLAAGTGQLLMAYLEIIESRLEPSDVLYVIENNLFAMDIEKDSLKAFLDLINLKYKVSYDMDQLNFKVADALKHECPTFKEGFDLILGNPPYIGEKGNKSIFEDLKQTAFGMTYYEGKMDYFYFFIYKSYEWLQAKGVLCFITTNYFLTADGAEKLRRFLSTSFHFADYYDFQSEAFKGRKIHTCMYVLVKERPESVDYFKVGMDEPVKISSDIIYDDFGYIRWGAIPEAVKCLYDKKAYLLGEAFNVYQGIVSGLDRHQDQPCFVYTESEFSQLPEDLKRHFKPFFKNSQIDHFTHELKPNYYIFYSISKDIDEGMKQRLEPFKSKLDERREVVQNTRLWYELTWPRVPSIFSGEKLIAPQRANQNYFAYNEGDFFASADVYFIKAHEKSPYSLKVLCALLNSSFYLEWLMHFGKRKGSMLELYATPLKQIALPEISPEVQLELEAKVDDLLMSYDKSKHEALDDWMKKEIISM